MSYNKNNIFSKILRKEANAEIVYENEYVLCFKDIFPKANIHILIIPKKEYTDIYDFSKNASSIEKESIFSVFKTLIELFKLDKKGCRIITNFGRWKEEHLHFHFLGGEDIGNMIVLRLKIFFSTLFQNFSAILSLLK